MKYIYIFLFIPVLTFAQKADIKEIETIIPVKLNYDQKTGHTPIHTAPVLSSSNDTLAYITELSPTGYLICSASKNIDPVIAYSYTHNPDNEGKLLDIVRKDLQLRNSNIPYLPASILEKRTKKWDQMLNFKTEKVWKAQQWPPAGSTSSGGWIETNWHQNAPYNNMCPMDPVSANRSIAGCPSVAMAMILDFHKTTNSVHFDDNDDYYHNYAGRQYYIDDDFASIKFPPFPQVNLYLDTVEIHFQSGIPLTNNDMSSLVFACGVAATQVYTSSGSGTFGVNQALQAYQKFNFTTVDLLLESDTDLYTRIRNNIKDTLPVHLAVVDSAWSMGHNVIIDGYNTDEYYHLNFGWGGSSNGWYLLPDEIPYGLTVVEGAVVDIVPDYSVNIFKKEQNYFNIYPNPAENILYIDSFNSENEYNYSIYTLTGRLISKNCLQKNQIDISFLEKGLYIIELSDEKFNYKTKIIKL